MAAPAKAAAVALSTFRSNRNRNLFWMESCVFLCVCACVYVVHGRKMSEKMKWGAVDRVRLGAGGRFNVGQQKTASPRMPATGAFHTYLY